MRKIEENKGAKTIVFYEAKRPSSKIEKKKSQKDGRVFSKNDAPLQRKGPFGNLEKLKKNRKKTKKRGTAQPIPIFLVPPPPEPPTTFTAAVGTPCAGALPVIWKSFKKNRKTGHSTTWESWEREAR